MVSSGRSAPVEGETLAAAASSSGRSAVVSARTQATGVSTSSGRSRVALGRTTGPMFMLRDDSVAPGALVPVYLLIKDRGELTPSWASLGLGPATPIPTVTVQNFGRLTPTSTGAVFTFQTDTNVGVTRVMEYRKAGDVAWTTFGQPVTRIGSHTAGFTGLTPGTSYETRMTLSASGFNSRVITAAQYPLMNFVTAATTTPVPSAPKLLYSPPTLVDPLTIQVPVTGGSYKGLNGRDVRWILPNEPLTRQLSIFGGRHHHIIGGEIRMTSSNTAFDLEAWTGDMFVEGVVADPTGVGPAEAMPAKPDPTVQVPPFYGDAFRPNSGAPGARFILQNFYIQVDGYAKNPDGTNGPHGDAIQCYTGPSGLLVAKGSVDTYYQGGFILPNQQGTPPSAYGPYRATDVDVHRHASSGGAGAWTLGSGPTDVVYTRCHARRDPGSNTSLVSGVAASSWTVSTEAPAGGRNCPRSSVGVGYVSPGYV